MKGTKSIKKQKYKIEKERPSMLMESAEYTF